MKKLLIHKDVAWVCLITAIVFALFGLLLPPLGVVHASVLILVAQFLVLCAGVLFNSATVIKRLSDISKIIEKT